MLLKLGIELIDKKNYNKVYKYFRHKAPGFRKNKYKLGKDGEKVIEIAFKERGES